MQTPQKAAPAAYAARAGGRQSRFGCRVGRRHLLLAPHMFSEVVIQAVIYPLPGVPSWFRGLLNQRGNLLPVFDVQQLLDPDDQRQNRRTVLILDQGSEAVGMLIDGLPQAVTLAQTLPHVPALPAVLAAHVPTAYAASDTVWLDFDHQSFFTAVGAQITHAEDHNIH